MEPVNYVAINVEESIGKTVGRRKLKDAAKAAMGLQRLINKTRQSQGFGPLCRKGVFRFRSFEEAQTWLVKVIVTSAIRPRN